MCVLSKQKCFEDADNQRNTTCLNRNVYLTARWRVTEIFDRNKLYMKQNVPLRMLWHVAVITAVPHRSRYVIMLLQVTCPDYHQIINCHKSSSNL